MRIIDTHAHLWDAKYDVDALEVINDFMSEHKGNVLVAVGTNFEDCKKLCEINQKNVFKAMGIHPQFATGYDPQVFDLIRASKDDIVAIGEIGLDYYYGKDEREAQLDLLYKQFELAVELDKPVILHCREASGDLVDMIIKFPTLRGVVHCYSGSLETAKILMAKGFYLGVGGSYTFNNNKKLKEIIKELGLKNVVLETDSPYLAPVPLRGKVNRPQYVRYVARAIADDLSISEDEVLSITNANALKLFNLENV